MKNKWDEEKVRREEKEGFGTRTISEPTEFCDVLKTIQAVPHNLRPAKVNELADFISKIDSRKCARKMDTYCSFFDLEEFTKKPDISSWLWVLKYNVGDMIADLENMNEKLCESPSTPTTIGSLLELGKKPNKLIAQLQKYKEEIKAIDLSQEEITHINQQMRKEWKREWVEANAWDYDEKELKTLKTPFDEGEQK